LLGGEEMELIGNNPWMSFFAILAAIVFVYAISIIFWSAIIYPIAGIHKLWQRRKAKKIQELWRK
jgi:hypothetical protein